MAQTVIFPKLGQTMEEGAIVKWLKQEGDAVAKGDILFEIETDKANLEVESFFEGTLIKIVVKEGVTVPVNTVVGYIGAAGEKAPDAPPPPPAAAPKPAAPAPSARGESRQLQATPGDAARTPPPAAAMTPEPRPLTPAAPPPASQAPSRLVISPRAKALAHDCAIDPARVRGSGPNGRIVEQDLRAHLAAHGYDKLLVSPAAKRMAQEQAVDLLSVRGTGDHGRIMVADIERAARRKPQALSRMRQVIARRLVESKQTIPHFYVTVAADMTELMKLRADLKARGLVYSVNDFILEAVVLALEEFPVVNSTTDGRSVSWRGDVELGVAVSVDNGLLVPVVHAAQLLTLAELRDQAKALAEKARQGKLTPDEMSGSSFTVSNMGMLDVENFSAIINPGEAAILAVSSAREQPMAVKGEIRLRTMMKMTMSADHRIVDGATAARFANAIRTKLENVELWRTLA
ncbi:MAG: dihydrolipoamide acetyltransferase family protein [Kiritimatiellae bacterium]|nr:dihydrolipoamide acetyltransferase family protein [Kiritimatiellia bacterium]